MVDIKIVKPQIWNFEVIKGNDAWKEVVYSARVSGVPPTVEDKDVFKVLVENDYGSALEHVIIKFDLKMTKGNAPEWLEHRIISHSGFSTRYIRASEGVEKQTPVYEVILPLHMLGEDKTEEKEILRKQIEGAIRIYEELIEKGWPKEAARYCLPFAQAVGIYHVTINLRSLLNLLSLRLCVRSSPEFRCLASQLYFGLTKNLPMIQGLVGCRGFMRGACPESGVTGVRTGKPHAFYPPCPFKVPQSPVYIVTKSELQKGIQVSAFDRQKAIEVQEMLFKKWASWE